MAKQITIKNVNGSKALIVNELASNLFDLYKRAKNEGLTFYVNVGGKIQQWGLFSVAEFLKVADASILLKQI